MNNDRIVRLFSLSLLLLYLYCDGATAADLPKTTNSLGMEFRLIPAGEFLMGTPQVEAEAIISKVTMAWYRESAPSEWPQRRVRISRPFHLAVHEVTLAQFRSFVLASGYQTDAERDGKGAAGRRSEKWVEQSPGFSWREMGYVRQDDEPVVNVSWNDANTFCEWLTKKEGQTYRLPTEAEWEYACRAGSEGTFPWGPDATRRKEFAWNSDNSNDHPRKVGYLQPNAWGLYDMLGNVYEYCRDGWTPNLPRAELLTDPLVPPTGDLIVVRGTSWGTNPMHCRSAFRGSAAKDHRNQRDGFRVVRETAGE